MKKLLLLTVFVIPALVGRNVTIVNETPYTLKLVRVKVGQPGKKDGEDVISAGSLHINNMKKDTIVSVDLADAKTWRRGKPYLTNLTKEQKLEIAKMATDAEKLRIKEIWKGPKLERISLGSAMTDLGERFVIKVRVDLDREVEGERSGFKPQRDRAGYNNAVLPQKGHKLTVDGKPYSKKTGFGTYTRFKVIMDEGDKPQVVIDTQ